MPKALNIRSDVFQNLTRRQVLSLAQRTSEAFPKAFHTIEDVIKYVNDFKQSEKAELFLETGDFYHSAKFYKCPNCYPFPVEGKQACSEDKAIVLPDFIEASIALLYKNASDAKIAEIRAEWAEQIAFNEKWIAQTNGAVLHYSPSRSTAWMGTFIKTEDMWGGITYNPTNLVGTQDLNFARFYTPSPGQAAQVVGQLTSSSATGAVSVLSKLGPTGAGQNGNYIIVWASKTGADWTWHAIGYAHVTTPYSAQYPVWYYVGTATDTYGYVVVCAVSTTGGQVTYNDILADCVYFDY